MIYLREFKPSDKKVDHPNLYPYNTLSGRFSEPLEFSSITVLYGSNGSGKSTVLNILANMLDIKGAEQYRWGQMFIDRFIKESSMQMACDERGYPRDVPENSRYIKSEDMLYEVKKIQQEEALKNGYLYEAHKNGENVEELREELSDPFKEKLLINKLQFPQEKYSNGETSLQLFNEFLIPDGIYLLDEPEVSLSLQSQFEVSDMINELTRFFNCQFIIATHSPIILSQLRGNIYDFDKSVVRTANWYELENVKFMFDFFMKYREKFENEQGL